MALQKGTSSNSNLDIFSGIKSTADNLSELREGIDVTQGKFEAALKAGKEIKEGVNTLKNKITELTPEQAKEVVKQAGLIATPFVLKELGFDVKTLFDEEETVVATQPQKKAETAAPVAEATPLETVREVETQIQLAALPKEQKQNAEAFEMGINDTESSINKYKSPASLVQFKAMSAGRWNTLGVPEKLQNAEADALFKEGVPTDFEDFKAYLDETGVNAEMLKRCALGEFQVIPMYHFEKIGLNPDSLEDLHQYLMNPAMQAQMMRALTLEYGQALNWDYKAMMVMHYAGLDDAELYQKNPDAEKLKQVAPHGYDDILTYVKKASRNMKKRGGNPEAPTLGA